MQTKMQIKQIKADTNILIVCDQEETAGVVPQSHKFYTRSSSQDRESRFFRNIHSRSNGHSSRGNSVHDRQESQCSDESESGTSTTRHVVSYSLIILYTLRIVDANYSKIHLFFFAGLVTFLHCILIKHSFISIK